MHADIANSIRITWHQKNIEAAIVSAMPAVSMYASETFDPMTHKSVGAALDIHWKLAALCLERLVSRGAVRRDGFGFVTVY